MNRILRADYAHSNASTNPDCAMRAITAMCK